MFTSSEKMTAFHGLLALMSFKTKPQQIFKTVWELLPCSNQNLFFQGIFVYLRNGWYRMLFLVWFVHFQKGYPFRSLEHQSRNKLRAGSPFLPKCLVRCSKSYSQELLLRLPPHSLKLLNLQHCTRSSLTWKTLLASHSSSSKPVLLSLSVSFWADTQLERWGGWNHALDNIANLVPLLVAWCYHFRIKMEIIKNHFQSSPAALQGFVLMLAPL